MFSSSLGLDLRAQNLICNRSVRVESKYHTKFRTINNLKTLQNGTPDALLGSMFKI